MNIVICMVFGRPQLNFRLSKEAKKLNILPLFFGINYFDFCIFCQYILKGNVYIVYVYIVKYWTLWMLCLSKMNYVK